MSTKTAWACRVVALAATFIEPGAALAQASDPKVVAGERIEVTGSHIKRIDGETALPVTVMSREEIARSGSLTAGELLDKISANIPAYSLSFGLGDSGTPGLVAAGLRGLGSTSTLVLLNGRRLSNYAFNANGGGTVNLNQIPLAAVERVEILKDGASAIYGTDAIGGVVNFIVRRDYQGGEASAYATHVDRGGGDTRRYIAALGFGDIERERLNVLATFDYQKNEALSARQREFARTAIRSDLGFSATSGNVFPANFTFAGRQYNLTAAQGCLPEQGAFRVVARTGAPAPLQSFCRYDFTSVLDIFPAWEGRAAFLRAAVQLAPDHQLAVEYHRSRNEVLFAASETPVANFGAGPLRYPANGPYYPREVTLPDGSVVRPTGDLSFNWRLKPAGLRTDRIETDESRALASLQGRLAGWDYDTAISRSESRVGDNYVGGFVRESVLRAGIATGLIDVFSGRPLDAAGQALVEAAQIREKVRDSIARVTAADLKVSRDLVPLAAGPLALALGLEHRREELDDRPGEILFAGDIMAGGGALPPTRANRHVSSAFAELGVPLAKSLEAQLAIRHDRYSDFGTTTNPKVALRWNPAPTWLLRASAGSGFRAPTLPDLYLPRFLIQVGPHSDPVRCPGGNPIGGFVLADQDCDTFVNGEFGGNAALKPEKSRQGTLGIVFEPAQGWALALDFFAIQVRDRIGALFSDTVLLTYGADDPVTGRGFITRGARDGQGHCVNDFGDLPTPAGVPCPIESLLLVQQNRGKAQTRGVDLSANGRFPLASGIVAMRIEGTYVHRFRFQREDGGPYFDNHGSYQIDNNGTAIPRWRHYASLAWRRGPWNLSVAHNFASGYVDGDGARRVAVNETYDAQCTWKAWRGLELTAGVRNVFDRDPPTSAQRQSFQIGYDPVNSDPRGRTFFASAKYSF